MRPTPPQIPQKEKRGYMNSKGSCTGRITIAQMRSKKMIEESESWKNTKSKLKLLGRSRGLGAETIGNGYSFPHAKYGAHP